MMQRCSSSRSSSHRSKVVGHCPCGIFHAPGSSLCLLFGGGGGGDFVDGPFGSPSGVDCTLSLSTPSSRSTANDRSSSRSGGRISNLCWDIFNPKQQPAAVGRGAGDGAVQVHHLGGEALLARRCANCDTTSTPLWRNGPRGPKSLCNACGIRYKKEERRASSAAAEVGQHPHPHAYPWAYAAAQATHKASPAEFKLIQGDDDGATSAVPFLSWRLNTPGLLHDYT